MMELNCVGIFLIYFLQGGVAQSQPDGIVAVKPPVITTDMLAAGRTPDCDFGKKNLTVDWNGWSGDYWCFEDRRWAVNSVLEKPVASCSKPRQAQHFCMTDTITYAEVPPSSGNHRPTWPTYGEYTYAPPQRWLHNLEHGAIVFLYHPCADAGEIEKLRQIVKGCLRRHIITPYNKLTKTTPFALLSWGCKLLLGSADAATAIKFIQEHAKHGAEEYPNDGDFNDQLRVPAAIVSDFQDSILCPNTKLPKFARLFM